MPLDAKRLEKPIRRIRKFLKKAPKRPSSAQIHGLRTSARRLQANIEALGLGRKKKQRRLLAEIKRVRKRSGKIRDVDVLTGYALGIHLDGEQDCVVRLVEALGAARAKHVKKLRALIAASGPRLRRELKRTLSKTEKLLETSPRAKSDSPPKVTDKIVAQALRVSDELKAPARLDKRTLHPYRLKVKELRYILQLSADAEQQKFVRELGQVKDAIGEWHDWEELLALAREVLHHAPQCRLRPKLREISEAKYQRALAMTNHMRSAFLSAKSSKNTGAGDAKTRVTKFPVAQASAAISA